MTHSTLRKLARLVIGKLISSKMLKYFLIEQIFTLNIDVTSHKYISQQSS